MTFDKGVPITEQRLAVARAKCVRKHGKRHRTGKRKSQIYRAKKAKLTNKLAVQKKSRQQFLKAASAYWNGISDVHPAGKKSGRTVDGASLGIEAPVASGSLPNTLADQSTGAK